MFGQTQKREVLLLLLVFSFPLPCFAFVDLGGYRMEGIRHIAWIVFYVGAQMIWLPQRPGLHKAIQMLASLPALT
jgi:hypothetical protein